MWRDACHDLARQLGRDPEEIVAFWEERAAIREYDGGLARDAAEREAFEDLRGELGLTLAGEARKGPVSVVAPQRDAADEPGDVLGDLDVLG